MSRCYPAVGQVWQNLNSNGTYETYIIKEVGSIIAYNILHHDAVLYTNSKWDEIKTLLYDDRYMLIKSISIYDVLKSMLSAA